MHAMETIMNTQSKPMSKAPIRMESADDRYIGSMLAAEVMAQVKGNSNVWRDFAMRLIGMTVEARTVFINAIKADKAAMTKAQTEAGFDAKYSKVNTNSLSVEVSKLTTIANALNSGATVSGWREFTGMQQSNKANAPKTDDEMVEHAGYETLVQYARTFSNSKAGRKADTLLVKLGKFIKANKPDADADATQQRLFEELVEFYNSKAE